MLASLLVVPTAAIDSPESNLLLMLAHVPDIDVVRYGPGGVDQQPQYYPYIQYINYDAMERIFPNGVIPEDYADYAAMSDDDQESWLDAYFSRQMTEPQLPRIMDGTGSERDPATFKRSGPSVGETMPDTMGFDYFAINSGLAFGMPPARGFVYNIDYQFDAVDEALTNRDYSQIEVNGLPVWCPVDCDGHAYDAKNIEPANLFDNRLGRKPPVIPTDGYLTGVFDQMMVEAVTGTLNDDIPSLADAKDYQAMIAALEDPDHYNGDLVQTYILNNKTLMDGVTGVTASEWADYKRIPLPQMVAFVDRQEGDQQVTILAALYEHPDSAIVAVDELNRRMVNFSAEPIWQSTTPLLDSVDGDPVVNDPYVYEDSNSGYAVVMLSVSVGPVADEVDGELIYQNRLYSLWVRSFFEGVFYVVWDLP